MSGNELLLKKSNKFSPCSGPVVTLVLDGVGISPRIEGDAVKAASMPCFNDLLKKYPWMKLKAHGTAVGLPSDDDMGNSEVGHNAMGAGRIFAQGARLINDAINSGQIWRGQAWKDVVEACHRGGTLHLMGLLSDGNVHSHINHLKALIERAKIEKFKKVRIHILLDGRDVPPTSALIYVDALEAFLDNLKSDDFDAAIASGGGRMVMTMDRYEADWGMVERGWKIQVMGDGPQYTTATDAINKLRQDHPGIIDQNLPGFVIASDGEAIGKILDGDAVIFFNFRGDRAIEISRAFTEENLATFDRRVFPKVTFAGMMQYDGDLKIPPRYLVEPPPIDKTMGEYLAANGVTQYAVSETQKFGHVTYFWNGNRSGKFDLATEVYEEIPSDKLPFDQQPQMKCREITDALISAIESGQYKYLRANFANGDMIGHTGNYEAAIRAMEAIDQQLSRLVPIVLARHGVLMITADHGNAEEMYQLDKNGQVMKSADGKFVAKTSHTLNPVPFILISENKDLKLNVKMPAAGLSNVAATVMNLLGYEAPEGYDGSLIE